MLAATKPPLVMAPSRQSTNPLPIGYSVNEFPFPNAPDPPPGDPLLSDNEHGAVNFFFDDMTSDRPSFDHSVFGASTERPLHGFSWMDLPPQFMGSTSFFGHHDGELQMPIGTGDLFRDILTDVALASFPIPPPPAPHLSQQGQPGAALLQSLRSQPSPISPIAAIHPAAIQISQQQQPQPTSAEVLKAASVLQSGSLGKPVSISYSHAGSSSSAPLASENAETRIKRRDEIGDVFTAMYFIEDEAQKWRPSPAARRMVVDKSLQWGSDQNFNQVQYTPSSSKETFEALMAKQLKNIECLEVADSADTTRASTPMFPADHHLAALQLKTRAGSTDNNSMLQAESRKRRRVGRGSKSGKENGENESSGSFEDLEAKREARGSVVSELLPLSPSPSPPPLQQQQQHALTENNGGEASGAATKKRRPVTHSGGGSGGGSSSSSSQARAASRKNLSEEQKRENHIKSEQKRRALIKEGFEDLCVIVPSLHGGGFSKSAMLTMTAEWLEELLKGNERLREQLLRLEM